MSRMVCLKPFRYPHGAERKLQPGDEFETQNDRHALVLRLAKLAKPAVSPAARK